MPVSKVSVGALVVAPFDQPATVPLPADYVLGDFLVCVSFLRGIGTATISSSWSEHVHTNTPNFNVVVSYQKADGTETAAVITPSNTTANHKHMSRIFAFRGVDPAQPFDTAGTGTQNLAQANIGPFPAGTPSVVNGALLVIGARLSVWTSVDTMTGDGFLWEELCEDKDALIGNPLAIVADWTPYTNGPPALTSKTFVVNGGVTDDGFGQMICLRASDPMSIVGSGAVLVQSYNNAAQPVLPTGIAKDDLLVCVSVARTIGTGVITSSWPVATYTDLPNFQLLISYKFAGGGGADTSPTITPANMTAGQKHMSFILALRGVDKANPLGNIGTASQNGNQANVGPIPAATAVKNVGCVLVVGMKLSSWTSVATLSGDSMGSWTEVAEATDAIVGNPLSIVADIGLWNGSPPTITSKTFTVTGGVTDSGAGQMIIFNPIEVVDYPQDFSHTYRHIPHRFRRQPRTPVIPRVYATVDVDLDISTDFDYVIPFVRPALRYRFRGIIMPQGYPARDPDADISGDFYTSKIFPAWRPRPIRHIIPTPDSLVNAAPFNQADLDHRLMVIPVGMFKRLKPHISPFNVRANPNEEVDPDLSVGVDLKPIYPPVFKVNRPRRFTTDVATTEINTLVIANYTSFMAPFGFFGLIAPSIVISMICTIDPFKLSVILESWIPIEPEDDDWIPLDFDQ